METNIAAVIIITLASATLGGFIITDLLPKRKRHILVTGKKKAAYYTPPDLKTKVTGTNSYVYTVECKYTDHKKPDKIHVLKCRESVYDRLKANKSYDVLIKNHEILKVIKK